MNRLPRALVACEFSGVVRAALERHGWEAWSCDFHPTEAPSLFHYQGDVRDIIGHQWDLCIMHPDCTNHVTSANRWLYHPDDTDLPVEFRRVHPLYPDRLKTRKRDREFIKFLYNQKHIPHIALENPVGTLGGTIGKFTQIIHPWQFGHDRAKSTCLWLKNLPPADSHQADPSTHCGWKEAVGQSGRCVRCRQDPAVPGAEKDSVQNGPRHRRGNGGPVDPPHSAAGVRGILPQPQSTQRLTK